jgi:hypothetical protein
METWVGLVRNGACIIQDLEYMSFLSFGKSKLGLVQTVVPGVTVIGAVIAPLQGAAVLFNLYSGVMTLSAGALAYSVMDDWGAIVGSLSADDMSVAMTKAQYAMDRAATGTKVLKSLCLFAISHGFVWLCLNTLKHSYNDLINCGLIGMEVALLILLFYMAEGVAKRFSNARLATKAAKVMTDGGEEANKFLESADLPVFNVVASAIDVSAPTAPWPAQPADFLAVAYTKELGKYRTKTLKEIKSNVGKQRAAAALRSFAYSEAMVGWLDLVLALLNFAAFIGYAIFPITYLLSEETVRAPSESRAADLCAVLSHHITPHHIIKDVHCC